MFSDRPKLLICEREAAHAGQVERLMTRIGFECSCASDLEAAVAACVEQPPELFVLCLGAEDTLNIKNLRTLIRQLGSSRWIALLAPEMASYEEVLRNAGCHAVLDRAIAHRELAQMALAQTEIQRLEQQNTRLKQFIDGRITYEHLLGASAPMRAMYRLLDQIARTDAPVLVTGEPGTERLDVIRSVHDRSDRSGQPLVIIDCAEENAERQQAVIFGPNGRPVSRGQNAHGPDPERSAFAKAGAGAVVLHRVEELSMETQRRLLDFVHRPFFQNETPGSPQPLARLMATAATDMLARVESGKFLRELFYRLNILQVRVPPLRERREDIPLLAQFFLRTVPNRNGQPRPRGATVSFDGEAMLQLFRHDWPGNVDELRETVQTLALTVAVDPITPDELPPTIRRTEPREGEERTTRAPVDLPLKEAKRRFETDYFCSLLKKTRGNMTMAARMSRVGRPYLYKKVRECGIEPEEFR